MNNPYVFASDEEPGTVKLADDYDVHHTFTPAAARDFAHALLMAAAAAESAVYG